SYQFTVILSVSADRHVLHSFPTRRSSDLARISRPVAASQTFTVLSAPPVTIRLPSGLTATLVRAPVWPLRAKVSCPVATSQILTDRKSTRLNSSHDQISYAVFCLKKTNNS